MMATTATPEKRQALKDRFAHLRDHQNSKDDERRAARAERLKNLAPAKGKDRDRGLGD